MLLYLEGKHHPQLALSPRVLYVAHDDESMIGYIAGHLARRFECDGELQWLFVPPYFRRKGVATELFQLLASWFAMHQVSRLCVNVAPDNTAARAFYMRHGASHLSEHWLVWNRTVL